MPDFKKRKDCFFGIHFDFHAMPEETVGEIIDIEGIEKTLDEVKPDMVQIDTKGHAGISSYMTKAGVHAECMKMDVLKTWREVTQKRGISLYAHHSGVYEHMQAKLHPDWAVKYADGTVSDEYMSVFGPYADEVLIPQLLEIAGEYKANGAWVDGECWATQVDYSDHAVQAWKKEHSTEPPRPGDKNYSDYVNFCRDGFKKYVSHYIKAVKEKYPDFEITSNWMYSHHMPEKRTVAIDYISGDYDCNNSVRTARVTGRCIMPQKMTWDLLAWGQNALPLSWLTRNRATKEAAQLCQEASGILALGGGFQFFNILYGTGGLIQEWAIPSWKAVAEFCREREEYCFRSENISDICVIYAKNYNDNQMYVGSAYDSVSGWVNAISDAGFSCLVLNEADLSDIDKFKVVVLPSCCEYEENTINILRKFVNNGGKVIVDGGKYYNEELCGIKCSKTENKLIFIDGQDRLAPLETDVTKLVKTSAEDCLYYYKQNYYYEPEKYTAVYSNKVGNGSFLTLCFDFGNAYNQNISYALKTFVKALFEKAEYTSFIKISGSDYIDFIPARKNGKLMINLINMTGEHNSNGVRTYNEIPALHDIVVSVKSDKEPKSVTLQPEHKALKAEKTSDGYTIHIDRLDIHSIIEIEE